MDWCDHFKLVKADYGLSLLDIASHCNVSKGLVYFWGTGQTVPCRADFDLLKELMPELEEPEEFARPRPKKDKPYDRFVPVNVRESKYERLGRCASRKKQSIAGLLGRIISDWLEANEHE